MSTDVKTKQGGIKGALNRFLANHVETLLKIPGSKFYRQFEQATVDTRATQEQILSDIMQYASDTVIGREYGFASIKSHDDLAKAVPVMDYEDHRPYVDRHARGEKDVLFPGKPMMYNRSSGTTALPKLIPVTQFNLDRTIKNRGKLWLYGLMKHYPGIFKGKDLTLVSPPVEGHTEDGTPYGSLSGLIHRNIPEFMKLVHTIPYSAMDIEDYDAKAYTLLRFSLASDVSIIVTGNPSTVLNLVTRADQYKEELIRDIRDGTLSKSFDVGDQARAECEQLIAPDPARATELDRIASASDVFRPVDYWPNLKLVHTWKNGNCRLVIPKIEPWLGEIPILDFGYLASEITATDIMDPATDGSVLQIRNGYYEFTPFEDDGGGKGDFLMAHELEVGRRYYIYVTTFSGLYRYDMNDVVEVVGRFNTTPIFKFLFKGKGITSMVGEKLSEQQFIEGVHRGAEITGVNHEFFIGYADTDTYRYMLYVELAEGTTADQISAFEQAVDGALCEVNVEYESKRKSDRLAPLQVVSMGKNFFGRYRELRLGDGAHEGQLKWLNLSATEATRDRLRRLGDIS